MRHGSVRFSRSPSRVFATKARTFSYTLEATKGYAGKVRFISYRALVATRAHIRSRISLGSSVFPSRRALEKLKVRAKLSPKAWRTLQRLRKITVRVTVVLDGHTFAGRFVLALPKRKL